MTLIIFLIILAVLVLSHELGHFTVAKLFGVRVDEFGFGFPPKIFSKKFGETLYSLNLLPFGGFVKIFGEDPSGEVLDREHKDYNRNLYYKPRYVQAAVVVAGVVANLILGWLSLSAGFMAGLPVPAGFTSLGPREEDSRLLITEVLPGSPAELAGLRAGYSIIYLVSGGDALQAATPEKASEFIGAHIGEEIQIGYKVPDKSGVLTTIGLGPLDYGSEIKMVSVTPRAGVIKGDSGDRPGVGVAMDMVGVLKLPFLQALHAGLLGAVSLFTSTASGLLHLLLSLLGGGAVMASVSGPVGLVGIVGDATHFGLAYVLALVSLISINLAVLNLVPFPALDGGRLFFLLVESLRQKPIRPEVMSAINVAGFLILLGLMLIVTFGDILKLVS